MEFIVLGDLHIERQANIFKKHDDVYHHQDKMLDQVIEYSKKNGGIPIIQTGDVFDNWNPAQDSLEFLVKKIGQSRIDWHFNCGNHDVSGTLNALKAMDAVAENFNVNFKTYLKPTQVNIEGQSFIFLPWPFKRHSLLKDFKKSIVIPHIEYNGAKMDNGMIFKDDNKKSVFKSFGHKFFIGHLHEYQESKDYVYCGSPLQNNFGESSKKYFLHVTVNKSFKVTYKKIKIIPTYILQNFHVKTSSDLTEVLNTVDKQENLWGKIFFYGNNFGFAGHPKILDHNNKGKKATVEEDKIYITAQAFNFDRRKLLKHNLKQQKVNREVINRTLKLARRLENIASGKRSANIT